MARSHLYYVFSGYLMIVFGIAIYIFNEKKKKQTLVSNNTQHSNHQIQDHFLAGKSTNLFILCATTFSTVFSGYTMIGVPTEAYEDGK